jgi:hypothetical protein
MQFVIDPLVLKFNKEIAAQREQIKKLIDSRTAEGATVSPDVFVVWVARWWQPLMLDLKKPRAWRSLPRFNVAGWNKPKMMPLACDRQGI